ncbi:LTA synthase family protein [Pseudomonas sp. NyZ704]|nr:LTA synthase family protein [Pseudomonas sp. NyZ704]
MSMNPFSTARSAGQPRLTEHLPFLTGSILLILLLMLLARISLLAYNHELIGDTPLADWQEAFVNGLRFDLRVTGYVAIPLLLSILSPWLMARRKWQRIWLTFAASLISLLGILELDFYREFHQRLNNLVFQYLREDPTTVISMLWHGFPVARLLLAWAGLTLLWWWFFSVIDRSTRERPALLNRQYMNTWGMRVSVFVLCLLVTVVAMRGTLRQGPPLRWGDAYTTETVFANHLGLNPVITLFDAAKSHFSAARDNVWRPVMPMDKALNVTREMLLTERDRLVDPNTAAVRRDFTPAAEGQLAIRNVVVILMESFAGHYVGAMGNPLGITPYFDQLAEEGLLFTRFFANGTHTHQGMFATMACFPNLPGFEYLMQSAEGGNDFSGLPQLLSRRNMDDVYVYNGDFAWDNQQGFFSNQGMTRFIGRDDYIDPVFSDPTWGVSDQDMFDRSVPELDALASKGPFYALLQSLSNHVPYPLPDSLPTEAVTGQGSQNEHLTAMRYSDWALGQFFAQVRNKTYFNETLFVIVGDHGFGAPDQLTEMDLHRFNVPMLMIAPGIQDAFGKSTDTTGSQVDVVPTIMGLLGGQTRHQCWGRDLLSLPAGEKGRAVIKPSGGNQTVAIIEGDQILILPKEQPPSQYRYQLGAKPLVTRMDTLDMTLLTQLQAYIQVATHSLLNNTAGATIDQSRIEVSPE